MRGCFSVLVFQLYVGKLPILLQVQSILDDLDIDYPGVAHPGFLPIAHLLANSTVPQHHSPMGQEAGGFSCRAFSSLFSSLMVEEL